MNILLVDDDPEAVQALQATLATLNPQEPNNFHTAGSKDAAEIGQSLDPLDVLVTNVVMEAVDGFTLSSSLQERFPGLKTIFTTEYDLSEYEESIAGRDVLAKPVHTEALLAAFHKLIPAPAFPDETKTSPETSPPRPADDEPVAKGTMIGAFKIVQQIGEGKWGRIYEATRTQSRQPVALEILPSGFRGDPTVEGKFVAEVVAKARIRHPSLLSVYNTEEHGKYLFSVAEYVPGKSLANLVAAHQTLSEPLAAETVRSVADAMARLNQSRAPHSGIAAGDIWLGADKKTRLSNLINTEGSGTSAQQEMRTLAKIVRSVLPGGKASSPAFVALLERMEAGGHSGFPSWASLIQATEAAFKGLGIASRPTPVSDEQRLTPVVETEKRPPPAWRRWLFAIGWAVIGVVALFFLGRLAYANFFKPKDFDAMVEVPGGAFIYQDNIKLPLPTFWIDKYEVTIAQYAKFLEALEKTPPTEFDSPLQPKDKTSHVPKNWDFYYKAATTTHMAGYVPIDVNCPVFLVDWYDAYAYAKWKGRRLPTEMEWEKAGRGPDGFLYPWGNIFDPKKCNSSADYSDDPKAGGNIDGYNRWSPVNAIMADKSVYGVIDLAGNVAEWTATWDPGAKIPVVRGGTYHSPDAMLTRRVFLEPDRTLEYVGFRTATSDPPPSKP